ncbi:hypothetical protein OE88DRAFT_1732653 [Heliocybe sulcata]|uniref:Uncharacterized protein n=1 Tax=Heliocybe sulcata TaxID=5364 RepID=A0A5C3N848_9AGAM|nr:hypothetical protein OE88DRAFT_1732653 [Heliocybe sulcata]
MSTLNRNQQNMIQILIASFLNGVYTMVFGASICALLFRQDASAQRRRLLLVNISLYVLCAVQAAITFWQSFATTDLPPDGDSGGDPRLVRELLQNDVAEVIGGVLVPCANLIADGLLVWRCYVLYDRRVSVVAVPIVLLIAGTSCGFAVAVFESKFYWIRLHAPLDSAVPPPGWTALVMQLTAIAAAMYTTSAITNLSMSGLIANPGGAFRIWKATRNIGKNKTRYLRVASLLLETGLLYSVSLVLSAIVMALNPSKTGATDALVVDCVGQTTQQLVGIFPAVIILMVALGKTSDQTIVYSDTQNNNRVQRSHVSSIHFASPPARTQASGATGPTHSIELETRSIFLATSEHAVKAEEV